MIDTIKRSDGLQNVPTIGEDSSSRIQRMKQIVIRFLESIQNFFARIWHAIFPSPDRVERLIEVSVPSPSTTKTEKQDYTAEVEHRNKMEKLISDIPKIPTLIQKKKVHQELLSKAEEIQKKQGVLEKHKVKFKPVLSQIQAFDPDGAPTSVIHLDQFQAKNFDLKQLIALKKVIETRAISHLRLLAIFERYGSKQEQEELYLKIGKRPDRINALANLLGRAPEPKTRAEYIEIGHNRLQSDPTLIPQLKPLVLHALNEAIAEKENAKVKALNQEPLVDTILGREARPTAVIGGGFSFCG